MKRHAFTLIEVLVVVAIIAMLIAILLPSLSRAKAQARFVMCAAGQRQLMQAFVAYSISSKGRLPGSAHDRYADWLGAWNELNSSGAPMDPQSYDNQPMNGTIWKYMGKAKKAYVCAADERPGRPSFSYTCNAITSGALVETMLGAHHPLDNFNNKNHQASTGRRMAPFEGVPILVEEDVQFYLDTSLYSDRHESGWCNVDSLSGRHLSSDNKGYSNIGYSDSHVGRVKLWCGEPASPGADRAGGTEAFYFTANEQCIRMKGKWVSGESWYGDQRPDPCNFYGLMDKVSPAESYGCTH